MLEFLQILHKNGKRKNVTLVGKKGVQIFCHTVYFSKCIVQEEVKGEMNMWRLSVPHIHKLDYAVLPRNKNKKKQDTQMGIITLVKKTKE